MPETENAPINARSLEQKFKQANEVKSKIDAILILVCLVSSNLVLHFFLGSIFSNR